VKYEVLLANGTTVVAWYAFATKHGALDIGFKEDGWFPEIVIAPGMWMAVRRLDQ
jgi:hypothetical protein